MDREYHSKRNLTPDEFKYYLGIKYNRLKKAQGGTGANQHSSQTDQIDPSATQSTAEKLASEHGVSQATVKRAGAAVAKIEEAEASKNGTPNHRLKVSLCPLPPLSENNPEYATEFFWDS